MSATTHLQSTSSLAATLGVGVARIMRAIEAGDVKPALTIDGAHYFDADGAERIAAFIGKGADNRGRATTSGAVEVTSTSPFDHIEKRSARRRR
jgi:hypothetical protein